MSNIVGLVFANVNEEKIPELTANRTMASVPFGGKYRLIDFPLSNMSNSGINNVGIIAKTNFLSLMDHVGSGHAWDLSKRRSGLTVLPPFGDNTYNNVIESIYSVRGYLESCEEEYILITNSDCVTNINYQDVYYKHIKNKADITLIYKNMRVPDKIEKPLIFELDGNNKITNMYIKPNETGICNLSIGMMLIRKDMLISLVKDAISTNNTNLKRLLQESTNRFAIYGYNHTGYCAIISSINEYFTVNMNLMNQNIRCELFDTDNPIYTKVRDDTPCKYGLGSNVKNSLIAQGCVIDGEVENCILSKGVTIGKGAKISNCIVMQDTVIGDNTILNYVIIDKDVEIKEERSLSGYKSYPIYIAKQSIV